MTLTFTLSFPLILAPLPSPSINIAQFSAMAHEENTTLALTHTH